MIHFFLANDFFFISLLRKRRIMATSSQSTDRLKKSLSTAASTAATSASSTASSLSLGAKKSGTQAMKRTQMAIKKSSQIHSWSVFLSLINVTCFLVLVGVFLPPKTNSELVDNLLCKPVDDTQGEEYALQSLHKMYKYYLLGLLICYGFMIAFMTIWVFWGANADSVSKNILVAHGLVTFAFLVLSANGYRKLEEIANNVSSSECRGYMNKLKGTFLFALLVAVSWLVFDAVIILFVKETNVQSTQVVVKQTPKQQAPKQSSQGAIVVKNT